MPFPDYGSSWTNKLTGNVAITEEQYEEAKEIYDLMECKTLATIMTCMTLDVYLLADIFEAFREVGLKEYRLDLAHFYPAPNFTWGGMLISTKVELALLTDIDMLHCERAISGSFNGTGALRHFKANNKYMTNFDSSKPSVYGAFLMSPPYKPEQCNNLFHSVNINGEPTWKSMTFWMQTPLLVWVSLSKLICSIQAVYTTLSTICLWLLKSWM